MKGANKISVSYNDLLYEKASKEYDDFLNRLKNLPIEKIIDSSYEKIFKEDLLVCIEEGKLSEDKAKALFRKSYPLYYAYQTWLKNDLSYMEDLRDTLSYAGEKALKEYRANDKDAR